MPPKSLLRSLPPGPWVLVLFADPAGMQGGWLDMDLIASFEPNTCWGFGLLTESAETLRVVPFGNSLDEGAQPMAIPRGCVLGMWELRRGKRLI